ncbi:hypothetical protein EDD37DRAFT_294762 [Exophiala viscosa]|uniref:Uncharacterized protein n=1 Tax=Exophiala viscosa TaxID=2486360 RepID=A0AAN6E8I7_9EURO|nr:hypothetical protein EDD36DRAFT_460643 [Exophiala viscosa]KAI1628139.1 hypothetical protein EDD37DRAFT_294762 [Exophiala viscosa]
MGLFGHKSEPTPAQAAPSRHSTSSEGSRLSSGSRRSGGFLHRNQEDPSISDARQRVASAEAAEREADRALVQARTAVRDAREHIKRIEMEAAEEARLAKIKQQNARDISKRAKPLGRHDHY